VPVASRSLPKSPRIGIVAVSALKSGARPPVATIRSDAREKPGNLGSRRMRGARWTAWLRNALAGSVGALVLVALLILVPYAISGRVHQPRSRPARYSPWLARDLRMVAISKPA
jgi:hypothetical protein